MSSQIDSGLDGSARSWRLHFRRDDVQPDQAAMLTFHGSADILVPLEQSERFMETAEKFGAEVEEIVRPRLRHDWLTTPIDVARMAPGSTSISNRVCLAA